MKNLNKFHIILLIGTIFFLAWGLISFKAVNLFASGPICLTHVNDTSPEYIILADSGDNYLLGIIGNEKIKPVRGLPDYSKKSYIDKFFNQVNCPKDINKFSEDTEGYLDSFREFRMKKDITNN